MGMDELYLEFESLSPEMQEHYNYLEEQAKQYKSSYSELKNLNIDLMKKFDELLSMNKQLMALNKELSDSNSKLIELTKATPSANNDKKFEQATTRDGLPMWEYTHTNSGNDKGINQLGKDGWEMTTTSENTVYFRRPVKKQPEPEYGR